MTARLAIALVHHPVLDAQGGVVTSTLTNIDVHDLSRSAKTYGCSDFFMVHPIEAQRTIIEDAAAIFMLDQPNIHVVRSDVKGYADNPAYGHVAFVNELSR